jgi:hypothetical protein
MKVLFRVRLLDVDGAHGMAAKAALSFGVTEFGFDRRQGNHDMHRSTLMHWTAAAIFLSASALAGTAAVSAKHAVAVPYAANSLTAAVSAAEKRLQGQAVGAGYRQQDDGRRVYEIEVRNRSNVFDVEVDADKGTVIATAEGRPGAKDDKPD